MQIFLDTANIEEIKKGLEFGVVDGVTTNPTLIAKEKKDFLPLIREITTIVTGPVSVEVTAENVEGMLAQAREYADIAENIVIKVPVNLEGMRVVRILTSENIKTNVTLIFSASQALLAAKAGATFVSPFVGRIDDISGEGMNVVEEIMHIYTNYDFPTQVIVASVRHPLHFVQAAQIGAHVATIPFKTLSQLLHHPLTSAGMAQFLADWKTLPSKS